MRRFLFVTRAVAGRTLHNAFVNPAILLPSLIFPLFFLVAFAGGLSTVSKLPHFNYKPGYTSFQWLRPFAAVNSLAVWVPVVESRRRWSPRRGCRGRFAGT